MKSPTPAAEAVALARLAVVTGANDQTGDEITVHFNPVSLQLQVSNELKDTKNNERKQYVAKTSSKLTMDLLFDTTDTGEDVTATTRQLQAFLAPPPPPGRPKAKETPPPLVLFEWGTLKFKGVAEGYKETMDFFSPNGVPLRSSVNLTLSRQDQVFDGPAGDDAPENAGSLDDDFTLDTPATSASAAANGMQNPGAARAVAAANGQESLRFGAGGGLTVRASSVELRPPVAFASGGSGAGADLGVRGGAGVGVSAPAGLAGMARLPATEGAFGGLRVGADATTRSRRLDPSRLVPPIGSATLATDAGAKFLVGGQATSAGAGGLRADVGATGKLTFDAN